LSIERSLKKSGSFRGAWYLPVEFWGIAESTKSERKYDADKAVNLYYHLHDKKPPDNPLREKTPPKDENDVRYEEY
jgi:hypothetical protein